MNRLPNVPRMPNIKNRSSKHLYNLTRIGMRHLHEWQKSCGIKLSTPKRIKKTENTKKPEPTLESSDNK